MFESPYPDILGFVTGGERVSVNSVDFALATLPAVTCAGQPFQAMLLAQNNSNAVVELNTTLSLPGRKKRFIAADEAVDYQLKPGEVGYVAFPIKSHPETTTGDDYKLSVTINARPLTKPEIIRTAGEGPSLAVLSEKRRATIGRMRQLEWTTSKRFGLGDTLEASFSIAPAKSSDSPAIRRGWQSLWNLAEDGTPAMLLNHYGTLIRERVFPRLKKTVMFEPLVRATEARFKAAGYPLKTEETLLIAKVLTLVVHMADPGEDNIDYLGSQNFNVSVLFRRELPPDVILPRWFEALVRAIAADEQNAVVPARFIGGQAYDALLRDALPFAFAIVAKTTGEDMGTDKEIADYSDNFIKLLGTAGAMDFGHVYLPLIMGGVIVFDRIIAPEEVLEDTLRGMSDVLLARDAEWTEDNDLVFLMTKDLVNRSLRLFGFQI